MVNLEKSSQYTYVKEINFWLQNWRNSEDWKRNIKIIEHENNQHKEDMFYWIKHVRPVAYYMGYGYVAHVGQLIFFPHCTQKSMSTHMATVMKNCMMS